MNYGKLTAGTTKTAIDTAKPSEKGEIITYLSRMGDVLYNVFEGRNVRIRPFRIIAVVYGYAAHALAWEIYLRILPRRDIVAPQAGQILDYNKVDPLRLNVRYHPPKLRPLEAYARITVVTILILHGVSVLRRVAAQHLPLRGYACALRRAVVIL